MTEIQAKIKMAKLKGLTDELELLRNNDKADAEYSDVLKKEINKIQNELTADANAPIYPAYLYDVESGAYKAFPVL